MAVALEKLEEQLNCSICLDTYTNPKVLQCNHVFCQQCLVKLVIRDQQGQLILTCPSCRQVTPVPSNGVAGLQAAFRVNKLLEIVEEQKKTGAAHEKAKSASTSPNPHGNTTVGCSEHGGREVELYCNTCKKTICLKCIMKDHSHDYEELNKAFERYQQEITSSLEPLEKQLVTIKNALQQLDICHDEISNQQATIEADIHRSVARLHETLDVRKTELISQLHRLTQTKLKSLAAQRDQIETTQAQLSSCLLFMRENLKTGNQGEALMMKSTTVRQVKELTTTFRPNMLEPITNADLTFTISTDTTEKIQHYGNLHNIGPPSPTKCTVTGEGINVAAVGAKSSALLQIFSSDSKATKGSLNSITCELVSEITRVKVKGSVERKTQSQFEISYQPTIKGRHQLHIKVKGQHVRESPFLVAVTSSVEELGTQLAMIQKVKAPRGVAVNKRGEVVVAESGGHCVAVLSPSGERLQTIGRFSSGGWFKDYPNPTDVALDGEGNIFVTDQIDHRIQKFSAQGDLLKQVHIESYDIDDDDAFYPGGVAYCPSTDKVYAIVKDHVQILDSNLRLAGRFGKYGNQEGEFKHPPHIACDSTGNVYVADWFNSRIQVFTAEGRFLRMFGKEGEDIGEMQWPNGIAVDSNGNVFVSDNSIGRVSVFTSNGQLKTCLDITKINTFTLHGIAVDSCGVLYVCEGNSIKLF